MAKKSEKSTEALGGTIYCIGIEKLPSGKFRSVSFALPPEAVEYVVGLVEESPADDVLITKGKCKYAFARKMLLKNPWE